VTHALYLQGNLTTNVTTQDYEIARARLLLSRSESSTKALLDGDASAPSILGLDPTIDEILLKEACQVQLTRNATFHTSYRCGTLTRLLTMFDDIVSNIIDTLHRYDGVIDDELALNMYHIMTRHIFPHLGVLNSYFTDSIHSINSKYRRDALSVFIAAIIISLCAAILVFIFKQMVDRIFNGAMTFLRRCSPSAIVANEPLLKYLLDSAGKQALDMTPTQAIIHTAHDGIICVGINGIVDSVSESVTEIFGFIPEQLLGQQIAILFAEADVLKLRRRLEMMKKRECSRIFSDQVECIKEDERNVACHLTLMGIEKDGSLTAFVFIFRDVSELIAQQCAAEAAKASSEKLLYEILPRDIVNRLNQSRDLVIREKLRERHEKVPPISRTS
jgi:PAS domain S-box-containing protein